MDGMPYDVYTKLYDAMVWPVVSYGASIWGVKSFSFFNAVQNHAMRFFIGTRKYTPTAAVSGDMGWKPAFVKQWKSICGVLNRMSHMGAGRINRRVFAWADRKSGTGCKNYNFSMKEKFRKLRLNQYSDITTTFSRNKFISYITDRLMAEYVTEWHVSINRESGRSCVGYNKLRTYKTLKSEYETENYCKLLMPFSHRAAFSKFRCGVAPIRIETSRYKNLDINQRLCHFCYRS